ncbi:MAG: hypothetical protein ABSB96_09100 [Gaiellaceae bacterium]
MIDLDPQIVSELDRTFPPPSGGRADWQDIVDRAAGRRLRMVPSRRLVAISTAVIVTAALVAVMTPVGAAVVRGLDGFAAWISGEPGQPASSAEQQAFQHANERSWSGFAPGTELRRLIQTSLNGTSYTLYGFRSGNQLCLRLVASGAVSATSTHCAPLQALQTAKEPALVVAADEPFSSTNAPPNDEGLVPEVTSASFGIVSDGVTQVLLRADDGSHDALVASNAFLYVADHPQPGVLVRSVQAVAGDGSNVALPFQSAPGMLDMPQPPKGTPQGPAQVDLRVSGGTIGWFDAREPRGKPLPAELRQYPLFAHDRYVFGRVIQPDPQSADRIAVVLIDGFREPEKGAKVAGLCLMMGSGEHATGTCNSLSRLFKLGPLDIELSGSGSDQFSLLEGLASDDVAQIKLFLASGDTVDVPLTDNVFLVRVGRAAYPIRLVAYDTQQRVIDIRTYESDGMTSRAPRQASASVRELFRVSAADGTTAIVRAGDPAGGYRCYSIIYGTGTQAGGCPPWPLTDKITEGNPLLLISANTAGNDVFLGGQVPDQVASVTVTFTDGAVANAKTEDGFVVYPIPAAELANGRTLLALRAYDRSGAQIAQRGFGIRR